MGAQPLKRLRERQGIDYKRVDVESLLNASLSIQEKVEDNK